MIKISLNLHKLWLTADLGAIKSTAKVAFNYPGEALIRSIFSGSGWYFVCNTVADDQV